MTIKAIDHTKGKRPKAGEEFNLTVEFHNEARYSYYGQTKKSVYQSLKRNLVHSLDL